MGFRDPSKVVPALLITLAGCSEAPHDAPVAAVGAPEAALDSATGTGSIALDRVAHSPLIVFLGDSLTAASGLAQEHSYPARIQARLAQEGRPVRIVNAGVSGDTSAGGLARLDWMLQQKPDVVVVALGANDGLRGLPTESLERNLTEIIARSRKSGAQVLLLGMLMPPSMGEDYTRSFAAVFPRVAEKNEAAFVPFLLAGVGGLPQFNQQDGLHPNEAGQAKMAETVYTELLELLPAE